MQEKSLVNIHEDKLKEALENDSIFYHSIKYSFNENILNARFDDANSFCRLKDADKAIKLWIEGVYCLKLAQLEERSFNSEIFEKLNKRLSFHVKTRIAEKTLKPSLKIKEGKIFNLEIEATLPPLSIKIKDSYNDTSFNNFQSFYSFVKDEINNIQSEQDETLIKSLDNVILEFLENENGNSSDIINSVVQQDERFLLRMLLLLNYPSGTYPQKEYAIFTYPTLESSGKEISAGGYAVFFEPRNSGEGENGNEFFKVDEDKKKNFLRDLKPIAEEAERWVHAYSTQEILKLINKQAIKSAKSAIMSRNMSHNLGSHVMAYLKLKLNSVEDIVRNNTLHDLTKIENLTDDSRKLVEFVNNQGDVELPFLVGLGRFINYLQERQDYIATVATDHIPYNASISFKDFIYDELKPELRCERHDFKDVKGRKPENILLNYLAYSEGYEKSENIQLKFGEFTGAKPEKKPLAEEDFDRLRRLEVAIPGGITGRQAFFSIIENIIRNAAKHSRKEKIMEISLDLIDTQEHTFWENMVNEERSEKDKENARRLRKLYKQQTDYYHIITITNKLKNYAKDVDKLREGLKDSYVDSLSGQVKSDFKGLKEMRISAAWLRGYSIDTDIDNNKYPPALYVRGTEYVDKQGKKLSHMSDEKHCENVRNEESFCAVQYVICLPKPRKVAFVIDSFKEFSDLGEMKNIKDKLRKYGWNLYEATKFRNRKADYEIVVAEESVKEIIEVYAPARIVFFSKETIKEAVGRCIKQEEYSSLIDSIYTSWIKKSFNINIDSNNLKLVIADEKTVGLHDELKKSKPEAYQELTHLKNKFEMLVKAPGSVDETDYKNNIVYTTHYEGYFAEKNRSVDENSEEELRGRLKARFIEGVSGGNSTDRLIRKYNWNNEWYYKQLAAGLSKVAIFDERIFEYMAIKDPNWKPFLSLNDLIENIDLEKCKEDEIVLSNVLDSIEERLEDSKYSFVDRESKNKIMLRVEQLLTGEIEKREVESFFFTIENNVVTQQYDIVRMQAYYEKGVLSYDLRFSENDHKIAIVGYNQKIKENLSFDEEKPAIRTIGSIQKNNKSGEYIIDFDYGKFDFILIHQGLLDKIYQFFGIKDSVEEKCLFTREFYSALSKKQYQKIANKDNEFYLPQFIIHSGRSMPSKTDMPQKQPFIQFAALENAVKDCKYTLMELLYSAHYEESSSNNPN